MNREEILYLVPYILSLLLSMGIFIFTWRHQRVRGAQAFAWAIAGQTLSIFGFIMEMVSQDIGIKIIWDKFQWLTQAIFIVAYFTFAIQYTEHRLRYPKAAWGFLIAAPIIFCALVLTDGAHHLVYLDQRLRNSHPFPELGYDFGTVIYFYSIYIYGTTLYSISLLARRALQPHNPHRMQFAIMAIGFFIPIAFSIFTFFNISITLQRDNSPFTFALGNFIVAVGLFRYHLFDIIPIAREKIVEDINIPVIVLDMQNRIVDINATALQLLRKNTQSVVGYTAKIVFGRWKEFEELLENPQDKRAELAITTEEGILFYDVNISSIINKGNVPIGYIVVAHDITRQKVLETSYRILSEELDKRVKERTEELRKSEEKFFKAFQASPDAIVLAEFKSGRLVEVNEGFETLFGYRRAEVIGSTSLELDLYSNPSDRQKFVDSLQRDGQIHKDEYRIKTKSGETRLVQISAELIDINGKQHVVVINRDITEQKNAEDALLQELIINARMASELQLAYDKTLEGWSHAMDLRDRETEGHAQRVTTLTSKVAVRFGFSEEAIEHIKRGALLHDIGKMGIPDSILLKNGELTEEEWTIMHKHPIYAYEMLSKINYLQPSLDIPYCHHEKWDGSGYPRGLKGTEIPLAARIFAVADVWDALSSDRPYRKSWQRQQVIDHLKAESGRHFDPEVLDMFLVLVEKGEI